MVLKNYSKIMALRRVRVGKRTSTGSWLISVSVVDDDCDYVDLSENSRGAPWVLRL
jgi:hypothetical protein